MIIVNIIIRPFFFFFFFVNEIAGINVLLPDSLLICICHQIQRKRRDKKRNTAKVTMDHWQREAPSSVGPVVGAAPLIVWQSGCGV